MVNVLAGMIIMYEHQQLFAPTDHLKAQNSSTTLPDILIIESVASTKPRSSHVGSPFGTNYLGRQTAKRPHRGGLSAPSLVNAKLPPRQS